jgi:F-type H+-transporting ATPase subunit gamma
MANLKDIKTRIGSVKKTKQITSAMKLVAGAKLKRATDRATEAQPYQAQLSEVLKRVASTAGSDSNEPLLETRETVKTVLIVVLTSDRGLCGAFNNTLLRRMTHFIAEKKKAGIDTELVVFGRKGVGYLEHRGFDVSDNTTDWANIAKMDLVRPASDKMVSGFVDQKFDEVYVASNRFVSVLVQEPTFDKILPLQVDTSSADGPTANDGGEYRYEPNPQEILGALLPLYIRTLVLQKFLETEAGEHAARMTAMDNATRNASDLIDSLTLDYNRARQAAITTELIEIVSGAAAL